MKFEDISRASATSAQIRNLEADLGHLSEAFDRKALIVVVVDDVDLTFRPDFDTLRDLIRAKISALWDELVALGVDDPRKDDDGPKMAA